MDQCELHEMHVLNYIYLNCVKVKVRGERRERGMIDWRVMLEKKGGEETFN
jgi:hypothetical protein